jgi:hypothetical protein
MPHDQIRYDLLVQDALRGVVRKVLTDVARDGLPGEHHFYITFRPASPGVQLSDRMRKQYPEEMTIILQHQFWDLTVLEHGFEVGLSFSGKSELLKIPYEAITGFFDPSVQFGLKFELRADDAEEDETGEMAIAPEPPPALRQDDAPAAASERPKPHPAPAPARKTDKATTTPRPTPVAPEAEKKDRPDASDKVVSIDAFRKKP